MPLVSPERFDRLWHNKVGLSRRQREKAMLGSSLTSFLN
jgi:hypothetical protein